MLSKMANMGPNTHTKQTVNQLNANNIVIVPPSQEDLDMVVDYIYNKIMGEFEDFKQEKLDNWQKEMKQRQVDFQKQQIQIENYIFRMIIMMRYLYKYHIMFLQIIIF